MGLLIADTHNCLNKRRRKKKVEYVLYDDAVWGHTEIVGFLLSSNKRHVDLVSCLVNSDITEGGSVTFTIPVSRIITRITIKKF